MATQTVTQTNTLPETYQTVLNDLLNEASNVYRNTPYTPYPYPRIAGFTPDQYAGMDAVRGAQGSGIAQYDEAANFFRNAPGQAAPYYQQASGIAGGIAGASAPSVTAQTFPGTNLAPYMNPYTELVTNLTARQLSEQAGRQRAIADSRAAGMGQLGDDGHRLSVGAVNEAELRALADIYATGTAANYNNAQTMWTGDATRVMQGDLANAENVLRNRTLGLNAASLLGNLGNNMGQLSIASGQGLAQLGELYRRAQYGDADALMQIGQLTQGMDQRNLDLAYSDFQAQQSYPWEQLGRYSAAVFGNPLNKQTTTTQTSPGPNEWSQGIGLGLAGLNVLFGQNGLGLKLGDLFGSSGGASGALDVSGLDFSVPFADVGVVDPSGWADVFGGVSDSLGGWATFGPGF